ncbi:MAG TPA: hypothetical protein VHR42_05710, partial [Clostridia bacterium]|nr:hypothetical protein [Clostridia bacterium]
MTLFFEGHDFRYEASNLCYLFFPGEKVEIAAPEEEKSGDWAYIAIRRRRRRIYATVIISRGEKNERALSSFDCTGFSEGAVDPKECVYAMGRAFYRAASRLCGFYPPWGILTGIRPVKLA